MTFRARQRTFAPLGLAIVCSVVPSLLQGCKTSEKRLTSATAYYDNGSPELAIAELDAAAESRRAESEIIAIDRAFAAAMSGDLHTSETALNETRQRIEFLQQKDIREQTAAVLTDDKAIAWSGREFEQRMIDNMLILTSLLGDHQDAFAYATQAMEKVSADDPAMQQATNESNTLTVGHTEEISPPTTNPRLSANAFTAYLHAAVHSENAMSRDVTERSLRLASYWKTTPDPNTTEIPIGTNTQKGNGVLHVITFVGRVTDWQAEHAAPTTGALLLADQILSATGNHTLPPTVAPVKIARPTNRSSSQPLFTAAKPAGDSVSATVGSRLVDLNEAAWASYLNDRDKQIARSVARRIVKKGAIYTAKDQMSVSSDSGVDVLLNVGGIAWEALEKPDTRHLSLLPERIEVVQLELPAGRHTVDLLAMPRSKAPHSARPGLPINVHIDNGRNTFVLCYRMGSRFTKVVGASAVDP